MCRKLELPSSRILVAACTEVILSCMVGKRLDRTFQYFFMWYNSVTDPDKRYLHHVHVQKMQYNMFWLQMGCVAFVLPTNIRNSLDINPPTQRRSFVVVTFYSLIFIWNKQIWNHGNLRYPQSYPPINKALLRAYLGSFGGGTLGSHDETTFVAVILCSSFFEISDFAQQNEDAARSGLDPFLWCSPPGYQGSKPFVN